MWSDRKSRRMRLGGSPTTWKVQRGSCAPRRSRSRPRSVTAGRAAACKSTKTVAAVLTGPPATELEEYIKAYSIDLVVMTSHGRGGLLRSALGSVTDRLIGESAAPVLVVRPSNPGAPR